MGKRRWSRKKQEELGFDGMPEEMHGMYGTYNNWGCRCDKCKEANRIVHAKIKSRNAKSHGLSGYFNYGCRCDTCNDAARVWNQSQYLRFKQGKSNAGT